MRKLILLLSLLPLWGPGGLYAANCVSVHSVSANYATKAVTFTLTWSGCNGADHLYKAWVFVDYQAITGTTRGAWAPATIVGTPAVSNGAYAVGNSRGFYVTGVNGQTATVTVTLGGVPAQFNWCAYATDYPPNATINAAGGYTLHGTAPFTVNGTTLGAGVRTYSGACITSITDPTGCPGLIPATPTVSTTNPAAVCANSGVTLTANVSGGTTTANTYTWNIGGATTTTTTNTFAVPAASITASKTFTVSIRNANGCASAVSNTGTITVNAPGSAGQSSSPCGCAGGLQDCNGVCQSSCVYTAWNFCSGITAITTATSEGTKTWSEANNYCNNLGMRLPTHDELHCICDNKSQLPNNYVSSWYHTTISKPGTTWTLVHFSNCESNSAAVSGRDYVRCVNLDNI